jgi:hypothetical protein
LRLSRDKIHYLSQKILKLLQDNGKIHLAANPDLLLLSVADVIHANMRAEEDIEQEADRLLAQHRGEIEAMDMDLGVLRAKLKRKIARERGFIL